MGWNLSVVYPLLIYIYIYIYIYTFDVLYTHINLYIYNPKKGEWLLNGMAGAGVLEAATMLNIHVHILKALLINVLQLYASQYQWNVSSHE